MLIPKSLVIQKNSAEAEGAFTVYGMTLKKDEDHDFSNENASSHLAPESGIRGS